MTMQDSDIAIVTSGDTSHHSYVDWPAIIAGVVLASAISIVLLTFGSAIGLSLTSFTGRAGTAPIWAGIIAASWLLWVEVSSFMAGGYIAGRLRHRFGDATEHESDVRDGAHGLLVWAGALVVGAILAVSGVGATASAVGSAAATVTQAASNVAGGAAAGNPVDPNAYFVDTLFRRAPASGTDADTGAATPATPAPAATTTPAATDATGAMAPAADTAATTPAPAPAGTGGSMAPQAMQAMAAPANADTTAARGEAGRILAQGALGTISDDDRAYLGQLVAQNTGLTQEEAAARVDQVMTSVDDAKAKAAAAAETARRVGILAAFLIAASFLVAGAGAFWAAQMGGNHRDKQVVFAGFNRI